MREARESIPLGTLKVNLHDANPALLRDALDGGNGGAVHVASELSGLDELSSLDLLHHDLTFSEEIVLAMDLTLTRLASGVCEKENIQKSNPLDVSNDISWLTGHTEAKVSGELIKETLEKGALAHT